MAQFGGYKAYGRAGRNITLDEQYAGGMDSNNIPLTEGRNRSLVNYKFISDGKCLAPRPGYVPTKTSDAFGDSEHIYNIVYTDLLMTEEDEVTRMLTVIDRTGLTTTPVSAADGSVLCTTIVPYDKMYFLLESTADYTPKTPDKYSIKANLGLQDGLQLYKFATPFYSAPTLCGALLGNKFFGFGHDSSTNKDGMIKIATSLNANKVATHTSAWVTPKSINANYAITYGYNMLADNPYIFANSWETAWAILGLLPYERGTNNIRFDYATNEHIDFVLNYNAKNGPLYSGDNTGIDETTLPQFACNDIILSISRQTSDNDWEKLRFPMESETANNVNWNTQGKDYKLLKSYTGYATPPTTPPEVRITTQVPAGDFKLRVSMDYYQWSPDINQLWYAAWYAVVKATAQNVLAAASQGANVFLSMTQWLLQIVKSIGDALSWSTGFGLLDALFGAIVGNTPELSVPTVDFTDFRTEFEKAKGNILLGLLNPDSDGEIDWFEKILAEGNWLVGWVYNKGGIHVIEDKYTVLADFLRGEGFYFKTALQEATYSFSGSSKAKDAYGSTRGIEVKNYNLNTAMGVLRWKRRLVIWGVQAAPNMVFMSDINDPSYFPFPHNTITFDYPVLHVANFLDAYLVFTPNVIYKVAITADGMDYDVSTVAQDVNLTMADVPAIVPVKNMMFYKSGNRYYMLVPSSKVLTLGELNVAPISRPIDYFLDNFETELKRILHDMYSDCFDNVNLITDSVLTPDTYNVYLANNEICVMHTFTLTANEQVVRFAFLLKYDSVIRTWSTEIIELDNSHFVLYTKNVAGLPNYAVVTPDDTQMVTRIITESTTTLTDAFLNTPLTLGTRQYLDTGLRELGSVYKHRFREIQLKLSNKQHVPLEFALQLSTDNEQRGKYRDLSAGGAATLEDEDTAPNTRVFRLDTDALYPNATATLRCPVTGKGHTARFKLLSKNTVAYELLGHGWVYRDMNAR